MTGSGTVEVETLLNTTANILPDRAVSESTLVEIRNDRRLALTTATTAETDVSVGSSLSHTVSLGTALLNHNCTVGIYTTSNDSTADAFAVEVSYNGTDWSLWSKYTVNTTKQFTSFPVYGWRFLRVTYENSSGVDRTIRIDSGFWN